MKMLFGHSSYGELFHPRNGLLLVDSVESRFDRHQLVIVPQPEARIQSDGSIDRWVVKILDTQVINIPLLELGGTFEKLHNRELSFRTSARSAARYLYFHFLVAMLRAKIHGRNIYEQRDQNSENRPISWATPAPYLQEKMLHTLSVEVGFDVFKDRGLQLIFGNCNGAAGHIALVRRRSAGHDFYFLVDKRSVSG